MAGSLRNTMRLPEASSEMFSASILADLNPFPAERRRMVCALKL